MVGFAMKPKFYLLLLIIISNITVILTNDENSHCENMLDNFKSKCILNCGCQKGWLSNMDLLLGEILAKIRERFDVQIYFDDSSECLVNCFLKKSDILMENLLRKNLTRLKYENVFCNELYQKDGSSGMLKPVILHKCTKPVPRAKEPCIQKCKRAMAPTVAHLILLENPWNYEACCDSSLEIINQDIIVIVSKGFKKYQLTIKPFFNQTVYDAVPSESFWNQMNMDVSGAVYILEVTKKQIDGYKVFYYSGEYTRKLIKIWSKPIDTATIPEYDDNVTYYFCPWPFKDFRNHIFRVGFTNGNLHFHFDNSTVTGDAYGMQVIRCHPCLGPEGLLMTELARQLNFQFVLHKPINTSHRTAPSNHIIEDIRDGGLDLGVGGITLTAERRKVVDFLSPLINDPYTVLYYNGGGHWDQILLIAKPFDGTVWLAIGLSIILIWILMKINAKLSNNSNKSQKQLDLISIVAVLLEKPLHGYISPWLRLQVAMWFFLSISLDVMYKTRLASIAIKPAPVTDMSLDYMSDHGYTFLIGSNSSVFGMSMLNSSSDERMRNFFRNSRNDMDPCQSLRYIKANNAVIFDERILLWVNFLTQCPTDTKNVLTNFHINPDTIFDSYQAWPLKKNAPYQSAFNRIIARLSQSGILAKWLDDEMTLEFLHEDKYFTVTKALQLNELFGAFCIVLIGFFLSFTCFIVELFICRRR